MMMVPPDPDGRDFAIECFLEDWASGRADDQDAAAIRSQLRQLGDLVRLELVARRLTEQN